MTGLLNRSIGSWNVFFIFWMRKKQMSLKNLCLTVFHSLFVNIMLILCINVPMNGLSSGKRLINYFCGSMLS